GRIDEDLKAIAAHFKETSMPYAFILPKNTIEPYELQSKPMAAKPRNPDVATDGDTPVASKRFEFIKQACDVLGTRHPIVSTTGKTSRELFIARDSENHFYVVGSMGCASTIGLGLAQHWKRKGKVIVLDGDGAALMRLEAMVSVGFMQPENLIHVVLDNNAHDSTGGQQTLSHAV